MLPPTFVDSCFSTHVSILTRAEARVLLAQLCDAYAHNRVSILTRAEARVLQDGRQQPPRRQQFQSSPAPRRGCCCANRINGHGFISFNPHPRRGAGAAARIKAMFFHLQVSILTRAEARVLHLKTANGRISYRKFQSSPAPRRGCCQLWAGYGLTPGGVSILTRAEARVLQ